MMNVRCWVSVFTVGECYVAFGSGLCVFLFRAFFFKLWSMLLYYPLPEIPYPDPNPLSLSSGFLSGSHHLFLYHHHHHHHQLYHSKIVFCRSLLRSHLE
ncbi:hypothetical protein AOQ84DRAFT_188861 [Glonium stellatum]|uniref:Uncharacterized protein n=1 Tax=Glonium stellatum TaxID=574774 RepID=A0A8E2F7A9_9PEZI|nr:hypothetical protein AOQ84DRAFT_188861 [Glonium stellatum]